MKDGKAILDLDYKLDSSADVDMNVVMNDDGEFIEVQGTAEGNTFSRQQLDGMLKSAGTGIRKIIKAQKKGLKWA